MKLPCQARGAIDRFTNRPRDSGCVGSCGGAGGAQHPLGPSRDQEGVNGDASASPAPRIDPTAVTSVSLHTRCRISPGATDALERTSIAYLSASISRKPAITRTAPSAGIRFGIASMNSLNRGWGSRKRLLLAGRRPNWLVGSPQTAETKKAVRELTRPLSCCLLTPEISPAPRIRAVPFFSVPYRGLSRKP